jgi:hypothetical protein
MPRGDRTGPLGMGPMTGRGAGLCSGNTMPGFMNTRLSGTGGAGKCGSGFRGRGRGFCRCFYATGLPGLAHFENIYSGDTQAWSTEDEAKILKSQSEYLGRALEDVNARLSELGKDK